MEQPDEELSLSLETFHEQSWRRAGRRVGRSAKEFLENAHGALREVSDARDGVARPQEAIGVRHLASLDRGRRQA